MFQVERNDPNKSELELKISLLPEFIQSIDGKASLSVHNPKLNFKAPNRNVVDLHMDFKDALYLSKQIPTIIREDKGPYWLLTNDTYRKFYYDGTIYRVISG